MQLTKEQFYNYIKEHGITKAELTEDFKDIPEKTILYFATRDKFLSTLYTHTEGKNGSLYKDYDVCWCESWNNYKGKFKIIPEYAPTPVTMDKIESKIITKIKSLTAKRNKLDSEINKLIEML